jgi:hypothetical protein
VFLQLKDRPHSFLFLLAAETAESQNLKLEVCAGSAFLFIQMRQLLPWQPMAKQARLDEIFEKLEFQILVVGEFLVLR